MYFFIQLLAAVWPLVLLILMEKRFNQFAVMLLKKDSKVLGHISFDTINDFFPKVFYKKLESIPDLEDNEIKYALLGYKKLFYALLIYAMLGIADLMIIIERIILYFSTSDNVIMSRENGYFAGSIMISFLIMYWVFLTPVLDYLGYRKLVKLGFNLLYLFKDIYEKVVTKRRFIMKYVCFIVISFISLYIYFVLLRYFFTVFPYDSVFLYALFMLLIYQYVLLDLLSRLLCFIVHILSSSFTKYSSLQKYADREIMYSIFKNCTYLTMVIICVGATELNISNNSFVCAMGSLFLIDTFLAQDKVIQEKLKQKNQMDEMI